MCLLFLNYNLCLLWFYLNGTNANIIQLGDDKSYRGAFVAFLKRSGLAASKMLSRATNNETVKERSKICLTGIRIKLFATRFDDEGNVSISLPSEWKITKIFYLLYELTQPFRHRTRKTPLRILWRLLPILIYLMFLISVKEGRTLIWYGRLCSGTRLTLSLANSNCLTTTISASNNTRVTEPRRARAALTIGPRSSSCA